MEYAESNITIYGAINVCSLINGDEMQKTFEAEVKFTVLYHKAEGVDTIRECKQIERETTQDITVTVPADVFGLLENLHWAGTLTLKIEVQGHSFDNFRDKDRKTELTRTVNGKKGILATLAGVLS